MPRPKLPCRYRVNAVKSKTLGLRYRVLCRDTGDHKGTWNSRVEAKKAIEDNHERWQHGCD